MTDWSIARPEPPAARDEELRIQYRLIVREQTARRQGESVPLLRLRPELESPERRRRERAWRLGSRRRLEDAPVLSELWQSQVAIRAARATEVGAISYPALHRQQLGVAPGVPDAARRAQLAVEEFVTSVLVRLHERRRLQLGLRTIRPWDLFALPPGFPVDPLFATKRDAIQALERAMSCVQLQVGAALSTAEAPSESLASDEEVEELLAQYGDAVVREAMSGSVEDVRDAGEVARVAMPLLVLHGTQGTEGETSAPTSLTRVRIRHLERRLLHWTFGAMTDAFEEWAYVRPDEVRDADVIGSVWSSLWLRFLPAVDWTGLEDALKIDWQRHDPLFLRPGESMMGIAREVEVFKAWSQAVDCRSCFQDLGLTRQPQADRVPGPGSIIDQDLLDAARWMEDKIEDLEGEL